ncbi:hypothetical protein CYMTET_22575 [Cymbomonas tetramitiformis]|uniref:Uncharacterized protein n=1 Tax=Cymbomonas tetramitiformis TaxID=36881 RepID=A0AAE0L1U4_9CHLO|nr:hypothetical protein CYMTET_22575 [Cymbomonas tetramitiformis]
MGSALEGLYDDTCEKTAKQDLETKADCTFEEVNSLCDQLKHIRDQIVASGNAEPSDYGAVLAAIAYSYSVQMSLNLARAKASEPVAPETLEHAVNLIEGGTRPEDVAELAELLYESVETQTDPWEPPPSRITRHSTERIIRQGSESPGPWRTNEDPSPSRPRGTPGDPAIQKASSGRPGDAGKTAAASPRRSPEERSAHEKAAWQRTDSMPRSDTPESDPRSQSQTPKTDPRSQSQTPKTGSPPRSQTPKTEPRSLLRSKPDPRTALPTSKTPSNGRSAAAPTKAGRARANLECSQPPAANDGSFAKADDARADDAEGPPPDASEGGETRATRQPDSALGSGAAPLEGPPEAAVGAPGGALQDLPGSAPPARAKGEAGDDALQPGRLADNQPDGPEQGRSSDRGPGASTSEGGSGGPGSSSGLENLDAMAPSHPSQSSNIGVDVSRTAGIDMALKPHTPPAKANGKIPVGPNPAVGAPGLKLVDEDCPEEFETMLPFLRPALQMPEAYLRLPEGSPVILEEDDGTQSEAAPALASDRGINVEGENAAAEWPLNTFVNDPYTQPVMMEDFMLKVEQQGAAVTALASESSNLQKLLTDLRQIRSAPFGMCNIVVAFMVLVVGDVDLLEMVRGGALKEGSALSESLWMIASKYLHLRGPDSISSRMEVMDVNEVQRKQLDAASKLLSATNEESLQKLPHMLPMVDWCNKVCGMALQEERGGKIESET